MQLLATSPTLEGIVKLIGKYYYSNNISLSELSPGNFTVSNARGVVPGVCVKLVKGRFRFYSLTP